MRSCEMERMNQQRIVYGMLRSSILIQLVLTKGSSEVMHRKSIVHAHRCCAKISPFFLIPTKEVLFGYETYF